MENVYIYHMSGNSVGSVLDGIQDYGSHAESPYVAVYPGAPRGWDLGICAVVLLYPDPDSDRDQAVYGRFESDHIGIGNTAHVQGNTTRIPL